MIKAAKSEEFGEFIVPREGYDTQVRFEKAMELIRQRSSDVQAENGNLYLEKNSRMMVEIAIEVGWIEPFNIDDTEPKRLMWMARQISQYITGCYSPDPN